MKQLNILLSLVVATSAFAHEMTPFDLGVFRMPVQNQYRSYEAADADAGIIYDVDAPESDYYTTGKYYASIGGVAYLTGNSDGSLVQMAEKDGFLYIRNPFSKFHTDTYIKGEIEGDIATFRFPQAVCAEGEGDVKVISFANRMYKGENESGYDYYFVVENPDDNCIRFQKDGDRWVMLDSTAEGEYILGLTNENDKWLLYGNFATVYEPFSQSVPEVPDNITPEKWAMVYSNTGKFVDVAFSGDDVYSKGYADAMPDAWVKGRVGDGKITIPNFQYLGYNDYLGIVTFFAGATPIKEWNESWQQYEIVDYDTNDVVTFDYDGDARRITTEETVFLSASYNSLYAVEMYESPAFHYQDAGISKVPVNPQIVYFQAYTPEVGIGGIQIKVANLNADGDLLDADNMYYRYYVDGDPFELYPDEYGIEEPMIDIPFNFQDTFGWIVAYGDERQLLFTIDGVSVFGVQQIYMDDEETYYSEIINYDTDAVDEVAAPEVVGREYFDMSGVKVSGQSKGILLEVSRYADGSKTVRKIVRR